MGQAHTPEEIHKKVKLFMGVFGALMVLTIVTVGVSYLHLNVKLAIFVALTVATIKGSLVALHFMHLSAEKKMIYATLGLTVIFFAILLFLPVAQHLDVYNGIKHVGGGHIQATHSEEAGH